jgi:serine/threonine protein kinase/tetratricopeptide (TPR) repeat protein
VVRPGDVVADRFEIVGVAGEGGMGTVYRARDRMSDEHVALKTITVSDGHEAARFARETAVMAELAHPNIVRYVAHGVSDTHAPFLAMEWIEGETLQQRLARARLTLVDALVVARAIAAALGAAHARGLVHRDVKPPNVMLPRGDLSAAKVLDFGIARDLAQTGVLTSTGVVMGTPGYMAPEQVRGDVAAIDARSDVFSLGCVLYRCLTDAPAFTGESLAVLAQILVDEVEPPSTLVPAIPFAVDALVMRMLAKTQSVRPADGSEVAAELDAILGELGEPDGATTIVGGSQSSNPQISTRPLGVATRAITDTEHRLVSIALASVSPPKTVLDPEHIDAIASAFGGRAERLTPAARLIVFSPAGAAADTANRAARCALAMRHASSELSIVVASGRAATIGPLVGEVVSRAAKLLSDTAAGDIAIDVATSDLVDERFVIESGRLLGMRDAEPARTLRGRPTPMVGRDREVATLSGLWADCVDEPVARAALVTGPAGAGKSRLRHELVRAVQKRDPKATILLGRGDSIGAGSPFQILSDALRRAAGVVDGTDLDAKRAALHARIARHVPAADVDRVATVLGELAGVPFASSTSPALRAARADAFAKHDAMRSAWGDWLEAECAAGPVLFVVEDLHWGDRATVEYLELALKRLEAAPLFVVAFARPEVDDLFPRLWVERDAQELRLLPLTRKAGEKLVRALIDGVDDAVVARIVERGEGNPLFLEELVRSLVDGRSELPDSVLAMLQHRLDELDAETRRTLRAASVFGEVFWRDGVAALTHTDPRPQLATLVAHELVEPLATSRVAGDQELAFRHDLVREAAYATTPDSERVRAHALAAEWLVAHGLRDGLALADHFTKGGEPWRAAEQLAIAAEQANAGNDTAAALAHAARGLACSPQPEILGRLELARAEALSWRGEYAACAAAATTAAAAFTRGTREWFRTQDERFFAYGRSSDTANAMRVLGELTTTPPAPGAELDQVRSVARAAVLMLRFGPPAVGPSLAARVEQLAAATALDLDAEQRVWITRGLAARNRGDVEGTFTAFHAANAACDACHNRREKAFCEMSIAGTFMELGLQARAVPHFEAGAAIAAELGLKMLLGGFYALIGWAHVILGDRDKGAGYAERAVGVGDPAGMGVGHLVKARIALAAGDFDTAIAQASLGVELVSRFGEYHSITHAIRARAYLRRGDLALAKEDAAAARRLMAPQDGIQSGETTVRLVEVEVLEACGEAELAAARLNEALARIDARAARIVEPWRASFLTLPDTAATLARRS